MSRALAIDAEEVPLSLRWPEAMAETEDTNRVVRDLRDRLVAAETDRSREFGIKEGMLIALARRYAEGSPNDFYAALAGLERALEVARDERERGRLPSNISDAVDAVIARIDALNEAGDFDAGQALINSELATLDEEDERRRAARDRLYEKGIAQAVMSRSVENAWRFVLARFDLNAPADRDQRHWQFGRLLEEWYERGERRGLNFELEVAIALAEEAIRRTDHINQRGQVRNQLAVALCALGQREAGPARLEAAIASLEVALTEQPRSLTPLGWASTLNNLGAALSALGRRQSGTVHLHAAVLAYREALQERTRDRAPLEWAQTQDNLGITLRILGIRENKIVLLEDAASAHRLALSFLSFKQFPREWAVAQINLGSTLREIAARNKGTVRLRRAVRCLRVALNHPPREQLPKLWSAAQNNLGNALLELGQRRNDALYIRQAIYAYKAALLDRRREHSPLDWADTQNNLGVSLFILGQRSGEVVLLDEAVEAFESALQERTREHVSLDWANTQGQAR